MPAEDTKIKIGDYDTIMNDRHIFNQIVYTPLSEALKLLDERRKDKELVAKVEKLLKGDVPEILRNKRCAILCRQVATPNYENRRFIALAKENNLYPVFFEYHGDKFTSNNKYKHSLGQLQVQNKELTKEGDFHSEKITIVDFNKHNGKKLQEVKTLWNESLTDFHRKLFTAYDYNKEDFHFHDVSPWFKKKGGKATDYYTDLLLLFTCFGILFENFLTSKDTEGDFTKKIVLPAIEEIMNTIGVKPIIVPLESLELETDDFWLHHLPVIKKYIPK
jgi:hypothetical protein